MILGVGIWVLARDNAQLQIFLNLKTDNLSYLYP